MPLPLPASPRLPPGGAQVRLLRGPTQGRELSGRVRKKTSRRKTAKKKPKPNASTGKGKDGETHRGDMWSRLLALLPWFLWVSLQIPDTEISQKKKTVGAFSERPGKISSPLRQTVLSALHVAISCSVSSERALFFRGPFFFIADLYVMYHICRYFILCTLTRRQRT